LSKTARGLPKLLLSSIGTITLFPARMGSLYLEGVGGKVQFPKHICATCPVRECCTTSKTGRSVSIHPDEPLFQELQQRQLTPTGRAKLRERVAVEHSLSHIDRWQTDKARYVGSRKNLFDLRRTAVVHNLHVLAKIFTRIMTDFCS